MEELRYMSLFQDVTGVAPRDCVIDQERNTIIFVVDPGKAGKAIGKNGVNVKQLSYYLGKNIEVVEWGDDLETFTKNIFMPARVKSVRVATLPSGKKILYVAVEPQDKGLAIGRNGKNVAKAKILLKRHYGIDNVIII